MMLAEAHFHTLTNQVRHLLDCDAAALLLGCPEPELRHPLLDMVQSSSYGWMDGPAGFTTLLQDERVRALCDLVIQSGNVQSVNCFEARDTSVRSIAAAPLERPPGLLGLLLLTDVQPGAFCQGEQALLTSYVRTAAQELEQNLRDLYSKLSHRLHDEEVTVIELPDQKDEFISMVSHELRMPLTSIKGYAALLQAYGMDDNAAGEMTSTRRQQYLATIMEQVQHMEVLTRDLLDMSRIQAGRLALRLTDVDMAVLCRRATELAQQQIDQQRPGHYTICCHLEEPLPAVRADPDRVLQVLSNLLENAIKYSPDGGIIELRASTSLNVSASNEHMTHTSRATAELPTHLYITVRDRGLGIPDQQQTLLFKPFSRVEYPTTEHISGTGLGLYITRKLVQAMKGTVTLKSSEGQGTSVTFTLPLADG